MQINEVFLYLCAIAEDVKCGHSFPHSRVAKMVLWPEVYIRKLQPVCFTFSYYACSFLHLQAMISVIVEAYNIDWYMGKAMYDEKIL